MSLAVPINQARRNYQIIMSWAKFAIEALQRGETVQIRPRGHSMKGKINDGDLVTIAPCEPGTLEVGAILLVRVHGNDYLHLLKARDKERFQIGNNRGGINGWVGKNNIYGKAIRVEPGATKSLSKEALAQAT